MSTDLGEVAFTDRGETDCGDTAADAVPDALPVCLDWDLVRPAYSSRLQCLQAEFKLFHRGYVIFPLCGVDYVFVVGSP